MATNKSIFATMLRHPSSFAVVVLSVVILLIWWDYRTNLAPQDTSSSSANINSPMGTQGQIALSPPNTKNSGRDQPRIMDQFGSSAESQSGAPAIEGLVSGLEAKVKADPSNTGNRILLAQTYKELGRVDDATSELRELQKIDPDNSRVNLVLASILSQSTDTKELEESLTILEKVSADETVQAYLVHMYRGDAMIRQQNHEGALAQWKLALETMPQTDARYSVLEQKILELSNGKSLPTG
ncbi:tetratricopeptide repeat protein [Kaarinaea lacus]